MGASSLSTFPAPTVSAGGLTKSSSLWQRVRSYESTGPNQTTLQHGINTPDDQILIYATGNTGQAYTTSDCVNWTMTQIAGTQQPYFNDVAINSAMNLVVGVESSTTYRYATSIFGPFTDATTPLGVACQIVCDGTTFYMSGQGGQLSTSTNGTTWTNRTLTSATGRIKLAYEPVNNVVWAFCNSTGRVFKVTNGGATVTALGVLTQVGDYNVASAGNGTVVYAGSFAGTSYNYYGVSTGSSLANNSSYAGYGNYTTNNDFVSGSALGRATRFIPGINAFPTINNLGQGTTVSSESDGRISPVFVTLWNANANNNITINSAQPSPYATFVAPTVNSNLRNMVYGNTKGLAFIGGTATNAQRTIYSMVF